MGFKNFPYPAEISSILAEASSRETEGQAAHAEALSAQAEEDFNPAETHLSHMEGDSSPTETHIGSVKGVLTRLCKLGSFLLRITNP